MPEISHDWMRYNTAQALFEARDYRGAARLLVEVLDDAASDLDIRHGLAEARLLLARAYFHSAQLNAAEREARRLVDDDPTDGYAALLLGQTLKRAGRGEESAGWLRRAEALGYTA